MHWLVLANQEGLAALALFMAAVLTVGVIVAVRGSRILAIRLLSRNGYWNAAPAAGSPVDRSWNTICAVLAICVMADVVRIAAFEHRLQREQAIASHRMQVQHQERESNAASAVEGFLVALKQADDDRIGQNKAVMYELRYLATSTLVRKLMAALPDADDVTARGIQEVLAEMPDPKVAKAARKALDDLRSKAAQ